MMEQYEAAAREQEDTFERNQREYNEKCQSTDFRANLSQEISEVFEEERVFESKLSDLNTIELFQFIDDVYYLYPSRFDNLKPTFNRELEKRGLEKLNEVDDER
jgi:hypothetical protein